MYVHNPCLGHQRLRISAEILSNYENTYIDLTTYDTHILKTTQEKKLQTGFEIDSFIPTIAIFETLSIQIPGMPNLGRV